MLICSQYHSTYEFVALLHQHQCVCIDSSYFSQTSHTHSLTYINIPYVNSPNLATAVEVLLCIGVTAGLYYCQNMAQTLLHYNTPFIYICAVTSECISVIAAYYRTHDSNALAYVLTHTIKDKSWHFRVHTVPINGLRSDVTAQR